MLNINGILDEYSRIEDLVPILSVFPLNSTAPVYEATVQAVRTYISREFTYDEVLDLHRHHFPEKHI